MCVFLNIFVCTLSTRHGPCGGDRVVQRRGIVAQVGSPWYASFVCVLPGDIRAHSAAHSRTCDQEKTNSAKMCVFLNIFVCTLSTWHDLCGGGRVVQRRGIVAPVGSPWRRMIFVRASGQQAVSLGCARSLVTKKRRKIAEM